MTTQKHAYLIMAHNNFESLKYLLEAIDDERNDIFIHIDKKTKYADTAEMALWVKSANIHFVPRIDVRWGHTSMIDCELALLAAATKEAHYRYYHLLSGYDFPLKSQDEIHEFFENEDREFISWHEDGENDDVFLYKIRYYFPAMKWFALGESTASGRKNKFFRTLKDKQYKFFKWQERRGVNRLKRYPDIHFVKGEQWFSITDELARYLLSQRKLIKKIFKLTNAPDEFFVPTIAINSSFKNKVFGNSLRYSQWESGHSGPRQLKYEDLESLKNSKDLFARKISYVDDPRLVLGLMEHIGIDHKETADHPLVSVIVPIYNVEKYLVECLDSLRAQTYDKIEVIMVDDGATDSSGDLAKDYSKKDSRFIYVHQENAGLSAARNTGIAHAKGEYLSFVDSDDWVDPQFIEKLVAGALSTGADVTIGGFIKEMDLPYKVAFDNSMVYSSTSGMSILSNIFTDEYFLMILAWNKLYKSYIFNTVKFAVGKIHEDEYSVHRIIDAAHLITATTDALYHYRIRQDSITGAGRDEDMRHFHVLDAHLDRVQCCKNQKYGEFYNLIVYSMFEELILLMFRYGEDTYKKYGLNNKFRKLMLKQCIKNYKQLDSHQKREYFRVILSPRNYVKRAKRIQEANNNA